MPKKSAKLWTVGLIANHLGVEQHQILYLIKTRGIQPIGRAGSARVFSDNSVKQLSRELVRVGKTKQGATLG